MDRDDERKAVIYFRENPAEVAVPSVAMDEIGIDIRRVKIRAAPDRAKDGTQRLGAGELGGVEIESPYGKISVLQFLISETPHLDRHRLRELARQIIDVHARAAIDVWRIFVREEERLHEAFLIARAAKRTQI